MKTGNGTSNLQNGATKCNERRGIVQSRSAATASLTYSPAAHCALIALCCAHNHRSFESVADKFYAVEVEMLRPSTSLPHPTTVSRDIKAIYEEGSIGVREYFKKRGRNVHLVIDGWTAPLVASYLGICVVWYDGGKIHHAILELKEKHNGKYLAKCVVECLKRFGLEDLLLSACLDNAGNCDTLVKEAKLLLHYFLGMRWRTRCFPHITNLITKAFVSFFFKTPKKWKTITVAAGTKRKRGHA
ncbi:hypothetical protein H0H81_005989, partial [Sphagnurus paluster]